MKDKMGQAISKALLIIKNNYIYIIKIYYSNSTVAGGLDVIS